MALYIHRTKVVNHKLICDLGKDLGKFIWEIPDGPLAELMFGSGSEIDDLPTVEMQENAKIGQAGMIREIEETIGCQLALIGKIVLLSMSTNRVLQLLEGLNRSRELSVMQMNFIQTENDG